MKGHIMRTSVDNVPLVQVVDSTEHLGNGLRSILLRELAVFANSVEQLSTRGQLRDNVELVLRFEPVDKVDNVGVVEGLQHLQLVVHHLFVPTDIFLQDDLDGDFSSRGALSLADNTVCTSTQRSSKSIRSSKNKRKHPVSLDFWVWDGGDLTYFFS